MKPILAMKQEIKNGHVLLCLVQIATQIKACVMDIQTLIIFILFSFIFSDFTFLFLLFYFPGKTMKKACDKEVT